MNAIFISFFIALLEPYLCIVLFLRQFSVRTKISKKLLTGPPKNGNQENNFLSYQRKNYYYTHMYILIHLYISRSTSTSLYSVVLTVLCTYICISVKIKDILELLFLTLLFSKKFSSKLNVWKQLFLSTFIVINKHYQLLTKSL